MYFNIGQPRTPPKSVFSNFSHASRNAERRKPRTTLESISIYTSYASRNGYFCKT